MNFNRWTSGTIGLLAIGSLAWGCSSKSGDCKANKDCNTYDGGASGVGNGGPGGAGEPGGSSGSGGASGKAGASGNSGDAGAAGAASTCDGTLSPDADGCVISDEYGVFVSPDGDDKTGKGTLEKPYATLTTALASVDAIKRIYVCAADYTEAATLKIPSGVSIYGGFTCADGKWAYDATSKANFLPNSPVGADIESADSVTLQDIQIKAEDATSPSASSFGMMVVNSTNVLLTRVDLEAGKGAAGTKGADGLPGTAGLPSGVAQNGLPGTCSSPTLTLAGGAAVVAICGTQGGKGGDGVVSTTHKPVQDGDSGFPENLMNGGPAGGAVGQPGKAGDGGAIGDNGTVGDGASTLGTFTATGFAAASGAPGTAGNPGQGGGGGGASTVASTCVGSSGGAGGMGGCGGLPGLGGTGGGASVALMSWKSTVTLSGGTFTALIGGGGGDGGKAGLGGGGQDGGTGGNPNPPIANVKSGGSGGRGGDGGYGGSGAGGSGGPSFALVFKGTEPTKSGIVSFKHSTTGGAKGSGPHLDESTQSTWAPDGSVGAAADEYPIP